MAKNYLIIRQDYEPHNLATPKSKRIKVIEDCNKKMNAYYRTKNITYFDDEHVLILWDNYDDEKTAINKWGYSEKDLIYSFCEEINSCKELMKNIYIEKPTTLKKNEENPFIVLERILHIWKTTQLIPIFLEDNFLTKSSEKDVSVDIGEPIVTNGEGSTLAYSIIHKFELELETYRAIEEVDHDYFIRFFTSIETLMKLGNLKNPITKPNPDDDCEPFLVQYFKWQTGEINGETGARYTKSPRENNKTGVSPSTFYEYQKKFEASPYYPEWMNVNKRFFIRELDVNKPYDKEWKRIVPKSGNLPDNIWFMSKYRKEKENRNIINEFNISSGYNIYAGFENSKNKEDKENSKKINSIIDVLRIYEASKKTLSDDDRKGKLKPELKKRGLTMEDVDM